MPSPDLDRLGEVRTDWTLEEARVLFGMPFNDLLFHAQRVHRAGFDPNRVQVSTLLSIKTGGCPEDCAYCPQSVRYETTVGRDDLMELGEVVEAARAAKQGGATRFCMGAAYRNPKPKQLERIKDMVREVRALGLETCATLGMLTASVITLGIPPEYPITTSPGVWLFAGGAAVFLAVAVGLPPALHAMRIRIVDALAGR